MDKELTELKENYDSLMQKFLQRGQQIADLQMQNSRLEQTVYIMDRKIRQDEEAKKALAPDIYEKVGGTD